MLGRMRNIKTNSDDNEVAKKPKHDDDDGEDDDKTIDLVLESNMVVGDLPHVDIHWNDLGILYILIDDKMKEISSCPPSCNSKMKPRIKNDNDSTTIDTHSSDDEGEAVRIIGYRAQTYSTQH